MAGAVFHAKLPGDDFADSRQRPEFGWISGRQGACHEQLAQLSLLLGVELARPTQIPALERFLAALGQLLLPGRNRLSGNAQFPRDLRLRHAARQELCALEPAFLQRLEIPLVLHRRTPKRTQAD